MYFLLTQQQRTWLGGAFGNQPMGVQTGRNHTLSLPIPPAINLFTSSMTKEAGLSEEMACMPPRMAELIGIKYLPRGLILATAAVYSSGLQQSVLSLMTSRLEKPTAEGHRGRQHLQLLRLITIYIL